MSELSPAERKALKARAHHLDPVVIVGDAGLTPSVLREIDLALRSHELIKVRVTGDDRDARAAMYSAMCADLNAGAVQSIGKLLVLFRAKPEEKTPKPKARKPAGPRKTKKQLAGKVAKRKPSRPRA